MKTTKKTETDQPPNFTLTELRIIELAKRELSPDTIGKMLDLSEKSIKKLRKGILKKTGNVDDAKLNQRTEAYLIAVKNHLKFSSSD
ncbi:MAG: hypothetical protein WA913_08800 [Pricia sp.]